MLAIRDSSNRIVRMYWARGGASISISFSAARMNGTSLAKLPSQSMRLTSVVTCGYVRTSVELLVAAVHVAGRRLGPHDLLAVEAHDDPQRAVRRRVLRARC